MKKILRILVPCLLWCNVGFAGVVCYTEQCDPYSEYQDPYGKYQDPYSDKYIPSCTLTGAC
tara:strand:- start:197 stop:379 length:183 start_codon:yes stop_codon:yes gene_type:complete